MRISEILFFNITCPHCGTKITLKMDEYKKYLKETEGYNNEILCMDKVPNEENEVDVSRYRFDCPICKEYIPLNYSEIDADRYGFNLPIGVEAFYNPWEELSMDDYLKKWFNEEDTSEEDEEKKAE